jgi:hypothetical protein
MMPNRLENLEEEVHSEDLSMDGRIILKLFLRKEGGKL